MKEYINILKSNHNLILTGAPGTGKTYLARKIAEAMKAEVEFVQFHPSYDYTDFVEGLRPVTLNGNIGFERKDGIFKAFCKKALSYNGLDGNQNNYGIKQSHIILANVIVKKEPNFDVLYKELLEDVKRKQVTLYSKLSGSRTPMNVAVIYGELNFKKGGNYQKFNWNYLRIIFDYFKNRNKFDIRDTRFDDYTKIIGNTIDYSYYRGAVQELLTRYVKAINGNPCSYDSMKDDQPVIQQNEEFDEEDVTCFADTNILKKEYVFIIDEINRGELSKIFGELFYAIDPGYRGPKGIVKTQYQNLVPQNDIFKDGFYVPENVYIIGTMNDIDRSVESMDFAMRRRFAWKEILATERTSMWNGKIDEWKDMARSYMNRLNYAIENTDGLNSAYHLGPAYFLKLNNDIYHGDFKLLWDLHLRGVIFEYLRGIDRDGQKLESIKKAYFGEE